MASPSDCSMGARIGFAILGIIIGLCVCVTFAVEYHNMNASIWGLISGFAATLTLFSHIAFQKRWYEEDPTPFRVYMYCGCFTQLLGVLGLVVYIVLGITQHQGVVVVGPGYYVTAVWGFMTLKWGFQLFYFSRSYWRQLSGETKLLPSPENGVQAHYEGKCYT
ncbi:heme transporter HRG1-like [Littorina saxatilis]|uniref:Heme transporter hrg-1 n=1 Tax=Littorina saxatilis TaxID=31220 RepID=A0AAN9AXF7_9CAEN